ncbi:MAG: hypothetical protein LBI99_00005, partial [Propionibacteriaceae bacterium]|nr:hypothetical protein [Propionibacteriaceae bacterium]
MALTLVGAARQATTAAGKLIKLPAGTQAGDFLISWDYTGQAASGSTWTRFVDNYFRPVTQAEVDQGGWYDDP